MFKKSQIKYLNHLLFKKKQSLLHAIGGDLYIIEKLPPLKKRKLIKKAQYKEDGIRRYLQRSHKSWNDWIFKMHWNKLEWVNPRSCIEEKNKFCVSSRIFFLKENNKTAHLVSN